MIDTKVMTDSERLAYLEQVSRDVSGSVSGDLIRVFHAGRVDGLKAAYQFLREVTDFYQEFLRKYE